MNDDAAPNKADQVRLYLETLQARMDPGQFRVLRHLVKGSFSVLAAPDGEGRLDLDDEDKVHLTPEVTDELLVVLAIAASGTMEHHVVDLGDGAATVMDADAANDPEAIEKMRDWAAQQRREREHTDAVLRGIADASGT
ncbi:hypothetical protein [Streptomyces sp. NRRL B-24484]|uniref:hypothetical protein n=1 Tax=Streptomyces sp. NRRL B-24484 TaxID=1463833 RepID=UPI0004BE8B4A|nr:hypothetical protein [Streptomyces sp. NRRL B-24484]